MESLEVIGRAYAGRQVLVTGHTGFKGGWLSLWLHRMGAKVAGLALQPPTAPSLYVEARLGELVDSRLADVRDATAVLQAFRDFQPEIVFHLAAQPLVRAGYAAPLPTFETNVMGTAHILDAARHSSSVRAVVVVTTDKCYRESSNVWGYRETDPLGGHDPYAASKAAAELVASAWRDSYGHEANSPLIATARAGNVIGGGDWAAHRLVPDLWRAAQAGAAAEIRNPAAIRPWQHVLEPLAGYLALGERLLAGDASAAEAWNFGPELADMQPVATVCKLVCEQLRVDWRHDDIPHPREAPTLRLDSSKAMLQLGWRPLLDLAQACRLTGEWYARHARGADARLLSFEQIALYEAAAGESR